MLFADVVHSMDIAAAVGAGAVARDHGRVGRSLRGGGAAVRRHGGQVHRRRHHGDLRGTSRAWRTTLSAPVWQPWAFKRRPSGSPCEVQDHDGVTLQLRVGLNSGAVIAGEIGSGRLGYTAIGEQVGMAQRMESAAPPGGVMVSDSTARLVEARRCPGRSRKRCTSRAVRLRWWASRLLGAAPQRERIGSWRSRLGRARPGGQHHHGTLRPMQ